MDIICSVGRVDTIFTNYRLDDGIALGGIKGGGTAIVDYITSNRKKTFNKRR
jgi:hypothetical protein